MNRLTFNDWLQWGVVLAILVIAASVMVRKFIRFRHRMKNGTDTGCECGCEGCDLKCTLKEHGSRDKTQERD